MPYKVLFIKYFFKGRKYILTGNFCEAIETLYRVLSNDHKNYENYYHFGNYLR